MNANESTQLINAEDLRTIEHAVLLLESPGLAVRLAEMLGTPIEALLKALPESASRGISSVSEATLHRVLNVAVATMRNGQVPPSDTFHKIAVFTSGAVGGAAGFAGLAVELPITTGLIFRSIADIARAEGEDLRRPETILSCMEVFALGGPGTADDGADSAYLATRVAMSKSVADVANYLARHAASAEAPVIVRLLAKIAARFGIVVSYKTAAQLAPIIGAIGGAAVNTLFMNHYQNAARGHFSLRRLEAKYEPELVQMAYRRINAGESIESILSQPHNSVSVTHEVISVDPVE